MVHYEGLNVNVDSYMSGLIVMTDNMDCGTADGMGMDALLSQSALSCCGAVGEACGGISCAHGQVSLGTYKVL